MLVVVQDKSPYKSIKDLIAAAKAKPGALSFGSAGVGSQVHLAGENFADAAGIDIQHVPYKGEAPAYTDLIAGQTQLMVGNIAAAAALAGPGRLRALAVTGKQRSSLLPDVPTVAESGLPGFENTGWFGLNAPAGTPQEIVAKIQHDTAEGAERHGHQGAPARARHGAGRQHRRRVRAGRWRTNRCAGRSGEEPQADAN